MQNSKRNYDLIASMDVDKKRIQLAILNRDHLKRKSVLPYDPMNLLNYVTKHFPGQKVLYVYEAGPTGYGLYDFLMEHDQECRVAVASMIPTAPGQRVKTNRLDAYKLGVQAWTPDLKYVEVPEKLYRDLRHLTRLRFRYGNGIVATKNRLKGIYLFEGITFPEGKWSRSTIKQLSEITYRPAVEFKVRQLLCDLEFYRKQELLTKTEIRRFCQSNEELNRCITYMMSLPGIGWIVSSYVLGRLGGFRQLQSVKRTAGFFGLGPKENSTGETIRKGSITSVGDRVGRKMIVQASWVAVRKDQELAEYFQRIYFRNPRPIAKQKAIIAVARKLVNRIHAVLKQQRTYYKKELHLIA